MTSPNYQILLFYKYVTIDDPENTMHSQRQLCEALDLKGRLIIAHEGINVTLEGTVENVRKYIETMNQDSRFKDIDYKTSEGTGNAFPRLSVKVRSEIVSLHLGEQDFSPCEITGKRLKPEELHEWFSSGKEFIIVDMRNDYEFKVGQFKDSILPSLKNFRDLKKNMSGIKHLKNKTVLTVCTGGVRCEKASGYLTQQGFKEVYQLDGGIISYMEKYPNQNFLGKLYVFDSRVTMGFETDSENHKVIGKCDRCSRTSDEYGDCANVRCPRHLICCTNCRESDGQVFCSDECRDKVLSTALAK
jgi:UPF0176 protein